MQSFWPPLLFLMFYSTVVGFAQTNFSPSEQQLLRQLEEKAPHYNAVAQQIWTWAELGYQEEKSSALLQEELAKAGFKIEQGVADIPTAFVASYGSGSPVIGVLGEFDALPGVSQAAVPYPLARENAPNGHACGHHLFGTASVAAAIAVKDWLKDSGQAGTIRFYGTPAEEGGAGKVYMTRAGLFADVDAVLHWHPGDGNSADPGSTLANMSAKFRFYGKASHAAAAPERGRSALDGVEAMNYMVNMMREHVSEKTRIHYVITRGGEAPNVVPAFAEAFYYVRHPDRAEVKQLFQRLVKAAEGAAIGTATRMEYEIIHGSYNLLPNKTLAEIMYASLQRVGGVSYNKEEQAFADSIWQTLGRPEVPLAQAIEVAPFTAEPSVYPASTDVGDVSWVTPTTGLRTATWVPGTSAHSWQAVACGGTSIGHKGMLVAAKTISLTAMQLFLNPDLCEQAKQELTQRTGKDFKYESLLGDREPPLDYRE
ncbi:amidohydrolase [Lewinella sp. LCG006]|uniref:amidohydrolase n=1 Tax=Lewinella sp. LCG006 TaxID=3231911 RepID=UPI0034617857